MTRIVFVHTPMSTVTVPQRQGYWQNFDIQYHAAHPGLPHMRRPMWELPHWMHWLGGVLMAAGWDNLDVLDLYTQPGAVGRTSRLDLEVVQAALDEHPGDVYLFSPMTVNLSLALEIAALVKRNHPAATTVFGGVVATPLSDEVAAHPAVDVVVTGRGEVALPRLLDALEGRGSMDDVGQLVRRQADGSLRGSVFTYPEVAPADLPFPAVELFPSSAGQDIRYLRQVYALGCPYECTFCTIQTIGRKPGYFSVERVLAEIRAYRQRYGTHHNVYFGDETFTLHRDRTLALLEALRAEGDVAFDCQTRLNCLLDDRVLQALAASGCRWVEVGLETGVQGTLDEHKHRMKLGAAKQVLAKVRDAGLPACSFVVNGFPDQTLDDMRRSLDWVCELIGEDLLQASYLFGLVPYPGSTMFRHPQRFGMDILHRDYALYHEDLPPVFRTRHATPDQVYEVFQEGLVCLGEAMGKRPFFGVAPVEEPASFGTFWAEAHV